MIRTFDGIKTRMTDPQYREARDAFHLFNKALTRISQAQFVEISKMMNLQPTDALHDSYTFAQYIETVEPLINQRDSVSYQIKAFMILDDDRSGTLTVQKLLHAAQACSIDLSAEEAAEMLRITGPSVGENEFLRIMDRIY